MQLRAHKQTVNLFKGYAEGGDNDALKTFAQNTLPTLKDHLQRIQDIAGSNLASAGQQQNVAKADQKTVASASGKETSNQPTSGQINDAFRVYNPDQIRASTLIDKDVYGPDNKSIGTISDLVLEQDGKTRAALIDVGGFLGVGEKTVAIPFDDLQVSADASAKKSADANAKAGNVQVTVAMTEDQLKQLPAYEQPSAKRTAMQQPASDNSQQPAAGNADTASNQTAASDQANNPPAAEKQPSQEKKIVTGSINKNGSPASSQLGSQEVPASELMGATVYGSDNQSIGEIGDILFSKEGTIDAVVVDVGGFLGIGEKPVAVRFDSLNVREDQGKKVLVSVNTTEDQLKKAPKYERQSQ